MKFSELSPKIQLSIILAGAGIIYILLLATGTITMPTIILTIVGYFGIAWVISRGKEFLRSTWKRPLKTALK